MVMRTVEVVVLADGRMTPPNAAAYIGLSEKTLAQMRWKGTGPKYMKLGKRVFYFQTDADLWLNRPRITSTTQMILREGS